MNLTLPGLNDVWKESEEFRPLRFPRFLPCFIYLFLVLSALIGLLIHKTCVHRTVTNKHINIDKR